jgi:polyribonucleotide nucleotidyltransferase
MNYLSQFTRRRAVYRSMPNFRPHQQNVFASLSSRNYSSSSLRHHSSLSLDKDSLAHLALSSVVCRSGNTVCHVAVTTEPKYDSTDGNFLPLTVEYRSRAYAYGMLPDNYMKRDRHGSDDEVLAARIIDRSIRPMFEKGYVDDIQLTATLHCADSINDPVTAAVNASSLALMKAGLPWKGPVGCVRVGIINGVIKANITVEEAQRSDLNLLYTGNRDNCIMLEVHGNEIDEKLMSESLTVAQSAVQDIIKEQEALFTSYKAGNESNETTSNMMIHKVPEELAKFAHEKGFDTALSMFRSSRHLPRKQRSKLEGKFNYELGQIVKNDPTWASQSPAVISIATHDVIAKAFRQSVLDTSIDESSENKVQRRVDGRDLYEVRPITVGISSLPSVVHGSSIFRRGETEVVATATIGSLEEAKKRSQAEVSSIANAEDADDRNPILSTPQALIRTIDDKDFNSKDNFMLHYDFPAYSTGSVVFNFPCYILC